MFGGLRVTLPDGQEVTRFETRKAGSLLATLALDMGRSRDRNELADLFWPGDEPELSRNSLRQALASIRRTIHDDGHEGNAFVQTDRIQVRLNPALGTSDAFEFSQVLRADSDLHAAVSLYGGPLLPEMAEDHIAARRDYFAEQNVVTRLKLAAHLADGNLPAAIDCAIGAVAFDPLREESTLLVMELLARAGRAPDALRHYRNLENKLKAELNIEPSEIVQVFARKLASKARPRIVAHTAAEAPTQRPTFESNATIPLTPIFGRDAELAFLMDFSTPGESASTGAARVATLRGPGGIGKTRLAQEVAWRQREAYSGAVWFVQLAEVRKPAEIPSRTIESLGIQPTSEDEATQIVRYLSDSDALIVFDNFEQLVVGGTDILQRLVERLPKLRMLVTTRERLNVGFDKEVTIGPLAPPAADSEDGDIADQPSVRLFLDRAHQANADLQLTPDTLLVVARICRHLEGIPLALVIAGSRAQTLSLDEMLEALDDRFGLLSSEHRDLPERQRTLRESIRWSYQLLPDFKSFFTKLSVFRGGWTQAAAEAVCDEPESPKLLEHLRDRSLITSEHGPDGSRFGMLETVREFAAEELPPNDALEANWRHAEYFAGLAHLAHEEALGGQQSKWLDTLSREADNMRAALAWSIENAGHIAIELAAWLWFHWNVRGSQREAHHWLSLAVEHAPADCNRAALGRAFHGLGVSSRFLGDTDAAREVLLRSIEIYEDAGESERLGNPLNSLGIMEYNQGNLSEGRKHLERSLAIFVDKEDKRMIAMVRANLGELSILERNLEEAKEHLEAALLINRDIGNRVWQGHNLDALGTLALAKGDKETAARLFEESLSVRDEIGDRSGGAYSRGQLADVAVDEGRYEEALGLLQEAVRTHADIGKIGGAAESLLRAGVLAAQLEDPPLACKLWAASESIRENLRSPVPPLYRDRYETARAEVESALGKDEFHKAWEAGRHLPADAAIALLSELRLNP